MSQDTEQHICALRAKVACVWHSKHLGWNMKWDNPTRTIQHGTIQHGSNLDLITTILTLIVSVQNKHTHRTRCSTPRHPSHRIMCHLTIYIRSDHVKEISCCEFCIVLSTRSWDVILELYKVHPLKQRFMISSTYALSKSDVCATQSTHTEI